MEYTKIKVMSKDDPKRFYRIIAVQGDPNLVLLGALIGETLGAWFEHIYYFRTRYISYVPHMWADDYFEDAMIMEECHLSDLGEKFVYEYDTGEGYEFDCKVMKRKAKFEDDDIDDEEDYPFAFVVEGKGQGIYENDHDMLWRYLAGEIDPDSSEEIESEDEWMHLPMNMHFETYGDFDQPLKLDTMIYDKDEFNDIVNQYDFEDYEEDYDDDDDFDIDDFDEENLEQFQEGTRQLVNAIAGDIFLNEFMNDIFRELIKLHDINDAFDMIVKATMDALYEAQGSNEPFDDIHERHLNNLFKH